MPKYYPNTKIFEGREYYVCDFVGLVPVEADPEAGVLIMWAPAGGLAIANFQAFAQGDPGKAALIQENIDFQALAWNDPTPEEASFIQVQPGTDLTNQISKLRLRLRNGAPGANGTSTLDPNAYGTKVAGRILELKSDLTGFQYTPQKVGGTHWPTAVAAAPAGTTAGFTLTPIAVPAYPYPIRLDVSACTTSTASGVDAVVDLVARLNATDGEVIGRCYGNGGVTDRLTLTPGPDVGADAGDVTIPANTASTVYIRTEKQGGAETYQTSAAKTRAFVKAVPA